MPVINFAAASAEASSVSPGNCEWLDMGGLYRAAALREVGYFSNRNLHSYEEMDLGLRLGAAGWALRRLAIHAVKHHGRPEGNWALLARRWNSRYLDGAGELLRGSIGRPYFFKVAATQRHLFVALLVWMGLVAGCVSLPQSALPLLGTVGLVALIVAARTLRTGSLADACFGQVVWQVTALAMVRGFARRQQDPAQPIEYNLLALPDGR